MAAKCWASRQSRTVAKGPHRICGSSHLIGRDSRLRWTSGSGVSSVSGLRTALRMATRQGGRFGEACNKTSEDADSPVRFVGPMVGGEESG